MGENLALALSLSIAHPELNGVTLTNNVIVLSIGNGFGGSGVDNHVKGGQLNVFPNAKLRMDDKVTLVNGDCPWIIVASGR